MNYLKLIRYGFIGVLVLMAFLWLRGCLKDSKPLGTTDTQPVAAQPLPPEDQLRVVVSDNHILVQDHAKVTRKYVPPQGSASVTVKKDGSTAVVVKQLGWSIQPGLSLFGADELRLGLDVKVFYLNRFGVVLGLGGGYNAPLLVGYAGLTYDLDQLRLRNTALLLGYTTRKDILVGIRVGF